jgi:hypothetical protein
MIKLFVSLAIALTSFTGAAAPAIPTISITVHDDGTASFAGGGGNVKVDAAGNIDVYAATEVAFVFTDTKYAPSGIVFEQRSGSVADPAGKRNFETHAVTDTSLTVNATHVDASGFEYTITYKRADGSLGVIDPRIVNRGTS